MSRVRSFSTARRSRFCRPRPDGDCRHERCGDAALAGERFSGVFLKHSPPSRLVEAIRKVVAGEVWLDPAVTRSIIAAATGNAAAPRRDKG